MTVGCGMANDQATSPALTAWASGYTRGVWVTVGCGMSKAHETSPASTVWSALSGVALVNAIMNRSPVAILSSSVCALVGSVNRTVSDCSAS